MAAGKAIRDFSRRMSRSALVLAAHPSMRDRGHLA
jgi:hypothetical protein